MRPECGMGCEDPGNRRKRVLWVGAFQVLWALMLVYLILVGLAFLFGREVGYGISFGVCGGLALLVTVAFMAIYVLDRASAPVSGWLHCFLTCNKDRDLPESDGDHIMKKIISTNDAPKAIGPYSQAIEVNGFVFVSGQIPLDPTTAELVEGDIKMQTKTVMENGKAILAAAECGMGQVVKTTIYLKSMADFGAVNEVYGSYFTTDPPARATVEVAKLPKDAAVEIDFIAAKF